ncbi:hypothetical protein BCR33DRAFT_15543 [Rhizoclosmatium globosum]|uniref:Uncharacterized protein n=1 Tax=Rhizoclosmatium globosum TaxID=329046 RepID=A0A1Y2CPN0_9FUNG|nr:hypothetical protein BCR33DRAFT_15543 [Rhizoclosmatium globosum]|eukprot:ORY48988.1 hypothetical protein BCR33DRAFT_15543 [Rhizoclosmatium globosum]
MSCSQLSHTLRRNAVNDAGTQMPTIDSRRVIHALDQVVANLVVLLVVKNSMFEQLTDLSDVLDRSLQLNGSVKSTKHSSTSFTRQKDFVVSSIEFPVPPSITVAHILGLVSLPPIQFPNTINSQPLDTFSDDLLDGLTQENIFSPSMPTNENLSISSRFLSPPTTPPRNLAATTVQLNEFDEDEDDDGKLDSTPPLLPPSPSHNISAYTLATPPLEAFEISSISTHAFFGMPSPPPQRTPSNHIPNTTPSRTTPSRTTASRMTPSNFTTSILVPESPLLSTDSSLFTQLATLSLSDDSSVTPKPKRQSSLKLTPQKTPQTPEIDTSSPFFVPETPLTAAAAAESPESTATQTPTKTIGQRHTLSTPVFRSPSTRFIPHVRNVTPGKRTGPGSDEDIDDLEAYVRGMRISSSSSVKRSRLSGVIADDSSGGIGIVVGEDELDAMLSQSQGGLFSQSQRVNGWRRPGLEM